LSFYKKKILFVIDALSFGGGERVFVQIINGLDPDQYAIFLASTPNEMFFRSIRNQEVTLFPLDFSKRFNPALIFKLALLMTKHSIDIVHGQGARAEFYARVASRMAGKSSYISATAAPLEGFDVGASRKKLYRFFDWISERFVDRFIVVSDSLKEKMIGQKAVNPGKIVRIYNGIELDQFSLESMADHRLKIRKEFNVDHNLLLIGSVGRLVWEKGFEYLIQAIPDVIKAYPKTKFLIAGEGPLKERLEAQGARLKVRDSLIFTGFRKDIKSLLAAIDILVIPSIHEGFPMITLEGMAMAKPIVATRLPGIEEQLTNNETGLLVPSRDANGLARAIVKLLDNRELADTLGWNARSKVEKKFSVEKMLGETEKLYQSLT
jgi:glycosyltransferase involved in cell wall biosynthesis